MSIRDRLNYEYNRFRYRNSGNSVVEANYMGCKVLVRANDDVGIQILSGRYELDDVNYLLSQIRPGDIFFDIGANLGIFSLLAAKKIANITIHAFEPIPLNASLFESSIHLNAIDCIKLNRICIGDTVGAIDFSIAVDSAYSSMKDTGRKKVEKVIKVPVAALDAYASENAISRIDIAKIDVEGAEELVLIGAKDLLSNIRSKPKLILLELYDENLQLFETSVSRIVGIMKDYGYRAFILEKGLKTELAERHYNVVYNVFFEAAAI